MRIMELGVKWDVQKPGRLVSRKDLQCFVEVAEFWMYLLFSKGLFHRLGNPQAENSLSPALSRALSRAFWTALSQGNMVVTVAPGWRISV